MFALALGMGSTYTTDVKDIVTYDKKSSKASTYSRIC